MIASHLKYMINVITSEENRSDLQHSLRMIERHLGRDLLNMAREIYDTVSRLQALVLQSPDDDHNAPQITDFMNQLTNIVGKKKTHHSDSKFDLDSLYKLYEKMEAYLGSEGDNKENAKAEFQQAIEALLKDLLEDVCKSYGYSEDEAKAAIAIKKKEHQ